MVSFFPKLDLHMVLITEVNQIGQSLTHCCNKNCPSLSSPKVFHWYLGNSTLTVFLWSFLMDRKLVQNISISINVRIEPKAIWVHDIKQKKFPNRDEK